MDGLRGRARPSYVARAPEDEGRGEPRVLLEGAEATRSAAGTAMPDVATAGLSTSTASMSVETHPAHPTRTPRMENADDTEPPTNAARVRDRARLRVSCTFARAAHVHADRAR